MKHNKFFRLVSVMLLIVTLLISSTSFAFADTSNTKDNWVFKAPMACPRDDFQTVVLNNQIYAIGGINDLSSVTQAVEVYNPVTNSWISKAPMITPRSYFQAVILDNKIYAIGGCRGFSEYLSSVEEYDPQTNIWTAKKPMKNTRNHFRAEVVNGKIYAIGGVNDPSVEEYDPKSDTWTMKASMQEPRQDFCTEIINGKIIAIGGEGMNYRTGSSDFKSSIESYDPEANKWTTQKAVISRGRSYLQTQVLNGKIYIMGGLIISDHSYVPTSLVDVYDPQKDTCITTAPTNHVRGIFTTEIIDGHIFAIGGRNTNSMEEYDPVTEKWIDKASLLENVNDGPCSAVVNKKMYVLGGHAEYRTHTASNNVEEYNADDFSTPTLTVTASPNKVKVGQQFTTDVAIHNATKICAEDIKITFDKDLFEYEGATGQTGTKVYKEDTSTPGTVRFITACQGKDNAATGDKGLITLKFKAKKHGVGKVDIVKGRIADNATLEEDVTDENCGEDTITVDGYADVNRTGNFTLLDLGIDAYYYGMNASDTDSTKYDADVVPDGKIDDNDLTQIAQEILANKDYAPNN